LMQKTRWLTGRRVLFLRGQVGATSGREPRSISMRRLQEGRGSRHARLTYGITQPWTDAPQLGALPPPHVYVKDRSAFDLSGVIRMNCNPQPRVQVTVVVPPGDAILISKSA
jgi:hypothetical protein